MITQINASFTTTTTLVLPDSAVSVVADIYISSGSGSDFNQSNDRLVLSPTLTGVSILPGKVSDGSKNLSINVLKGDKILLIFYINVSGLSLSASVTGIANAGISITLT